MDQPKDDVDRYAGARNAMVDGQIAGREIHDPRIIRAFRAVPRHVFLPTGLRYEAYEDHPVMIGEGQTISQPYIVALMIDRLALSGGERVLEIGTGSGYQTALLRELAAEVYTIERIPLLADRARAALESLGYDDIHYATGDGSLGWAGDIQFDAIVVSAGAPQAPDALKRQLRDGGRLVVPVGGESLQELVVVRREGDAFKTGNVCSCVFVKLYGAQGWRWG